MDAPPRASILDEPSRMHTHGGRPIRVGLALSFLLAAVAAIVGVFGVILGNALLISISPALLGGGLFLRIRDAAMHPTSNQGPAEPGDRPVFRR